MCSPLAKRRLQRLAGSLSWAVAVVVPAILAGIVQVSLKGSAAAAGLSPWLWLPAALALAILCMQTQAEYQRRTHDLTWIFKYDDRFKSKWMLKRRQAAATSLLSHRGPFRSDDKSLGDVDDVLDFFDELGFEEQGAQISPETIHENFHYWLVHYRAAAREYIEVLQLEQPSRWEHVDNLIELTGAVARERDGKVRPAPDSDDLRRFLEDEAALNPEDA